MRRGTAGGPVCRPYGVCIGLLPFRRGRTLAGPLRGFCRSCPTLIRLAYARHLLPGREKAFGRLIAAPTVHRKPVGAHIMRPPSIRTGSVGSAKPGAEIEPQNLEFFVNPGPSGPEGIAKSHSNFARRKFLPIPRGNPRKWGPGPTPPVRGRWPEGPEGVGWANMSAKRSS